MRYIKSEIDIEGANRLLACPSEVVIEHAEELLVVLYGIEANNSPVASIVFPFIDANGYELAPKVIGILREAIRRRDTDTIYVVLSRVIRYWPIDLVKMCIPELEGTIRIGPIPQEEHDAEAAWLIKRHNLIVADDVASIVDSILEQHPLVTKY
ncbi:MAG: hypothetical protein ING73_12915 [Rhodocyclaceae bacterium]|nr:hypothetical protein [Rhodocyclaceae bacterium]MCA6466525.1 hypothetical protein [Chitinophagaceae bacterium]MCA3046342.1 hypothetical protein [Rhodocyclaceae bacterium]MCA3050673.1 hypothetical protein [Rhodocyclaceae bacterium]MCA3055702.1 hypothetical protein [Rhodocyclaceae bacterium]